MTKLWTIREMLVWAAPWFERQGVDSPRLTAELLLAHVLGVRRIRLYADIDRPLDAKELAAFKALVQRRAAGEPTQYVIGTQDFYGRTFKSDRRALIPRPETELLVERVLRELPKDAAVTVADVGCGTGALGLTIACERPLARVVLTDVSRDALALARENAEALGVVSRVEFREGSLVEPLGDDVFDAIVTNLPYVPEGARATLPVHIRDHEPHLALFAGEDGLSLYRAFVPAVGRHVRAGGLVACEHAEDHGDDMSALFSTDEWTDVTLERDLAKLERFTSAIRR